MANTFIPERLVEVRKALGINKAEAARRLELSKMGFGRYENGQRTPSPQTIEFMAQRLGTTVDYLTGMTDDPAPDYYIISKSEKDLFELIGKLRNDKPDILKRILFYYEELQKNSSDYTEWRRDQPEDDDVRTLSRKAMEHSRTLD